MRWVLIRFERAYASTSPKARASSRSSAEALARAQTLSSLFSRSPPAFRAVMDCPTARRFRLVIATSPTFALYAP
jgi:hypothetical protein